MQSRTSHRKHTGNADYNDQAYSERDEHDHRSEARGQPDRHDLRAAYKAHGPARTGQPKTLRRGNRGQRLDLAETSSVRLDESTTSSKPSMSQSMLGHEGAPPPPGSRPLPKVSVASASSYDRSSGQQPTDPTRSSSAHLPEGSPAQPASLLARAEQLLELVQKLALPTGHAQTANPHARILADMFGPLNDLLKSGVLSRETRLEVLLDLLAQKSDVIKQIAIEQEKLDLAEECASTIRQRQDDACESEWKFLHSLVVDFERLYLSKSNLDEQPEDLMIRDIKDHIEQVVKEPDAWTRKKTYIDTTLAGDAATHHDKMANIRARGALDIEHLEAEILVAQTQTIPDLKDDLADIDNELAELYRAHEAARRRRR